MVSDVLVKARLDSFSLAKAGAWLQAVPSNALGFHMRSRELKMALEYRLGFVTDGPCSVCNAYSNSFGDHSIACGGYGELIAQQNDLQDILLQVAALAGLRPTREEQAFC